jgi:hypothetical protein
MVYGVRTISKVSHPLSELCTDTASIVTKQFVTLAGSTGLASVMDMDTVPVEEPPLLPLPPPPPQPMKMERIDTIAKVAKDRPLNFISFLLAC